MAANTKAPDERGTHQRDLLRDEAADREPQQIDLVEFEGVDERDHPPGRRRDRGERVAGRRANTGVVDEDHLALGGQGIGQGGIPVVEVAAEVLKHQQWRPGRIPEAPVGEVDARRLDELSLGRGVGDR